MNRNIRKINETRIRKRQRNLYNSDKGAQQTDIDEFWNDLQTEVEDSKGSLIIIGNMNGIVNSNSEETNGYVGKFGEITKNNMVKEL